MQLIDNGLEIVDGQFQYAWFKINENNQSYYRVVSLKELRVLTWDPMQEDEGILGKQWAALRGLYNAKVDFLYTACGIFDPYIGLVQMYGAAANASSKKAAAQKAHEDALTVEATIAGYAQSKMASPGLDVIEWYFEFLSGTPYALSILGHPDPRTKRRGRGMNNLPEENDDLAVEQNEILYRGLAKHHEDFVFLVVNEYIDRKELNHRSFDISRMASNFASRQRGSRNIGFSIGLPIFGALNQSFMASASEGISQAESVANGDAHSWGESYSEGIGHTDSQSHTSGVSESVGETWSWSEGKNSSDNWGHTDSHSNGISESTTIGSSWGGSQSTVVSGGGNLGINAGLTLGGNMGVSEISGSSWGGSESHTSGTSESWGTADMVGGSEGVSSAEGYAISHTKGVFSSNSTGEADSHSEANADSESYGESHMEGKSVSSSQSQGSGKSIGAGLSMGVAPSFNVGQTWQTEDDIAVHLTELMRELSSMMKLAAQSGGFATNSLLFTRKKEAIGKASALIPQAFHGVNVPTPVMTVVPEPEDLNELSRHALAFKPYLTTGGIPNDPLDQLMYWKYATLLTPDSVGAYVSPGMITEGTLDIIPPFPKELAHFPRMKGEVVLGHQYSPTTAELTNTLVRLDEPRLMHTIFAGDTGFGKSVAAIRMAYEMAMQWNTRVIVLDFGFGWRQLLNAPGLEGRVDIRQLVPAGVRPLRWNLMQIGRYINPEAQVRAFTAVFSQVAQLGQKQQSHRFAEHVRSLYEEHGILVDSEEVRADREFGHVRNEEAEVVDQTAGIPLGDLTVDQRQLIAVHRSKSVGIVDLYERIKTEYEALDPRRDQIAKGVLEGILVRLDTLVKSSAINQYRPGHDAIPIEELARAKKVNGPSGVVVIEGGAFLDSFSKAWLLGWAGYMIYTDMAERRMRQLNKTYPKTFMVFEEANKIFTGVDGGDPENKQGPTISEQYENMFRDSRKYDIFFAVITQNPSLIPPGIRNSCNSVVINFIKDAKDKDVVMSALARSEKGFHDEPWRRFLTDMEIGMSIGRFPYEFNRENQQPFLFKALLLDVEEPDDDMVAAKLGRIKLKGIKI
ncbi:MAG: serine-rich protein [Anaerolineaceae bacterium]|nr:serine-rich protein [Anaerolineaceae bacterium]